MVHFLGEGKQATGAYRKSRGDAKLYELRNSVVNTTSERFYNSEKFKTLHPSILYYFMCKPHHPSVIIPDWHCRHWSMFGAKTLDKTLGWLRQSGSWSCTKHGKIIVHVFTLVCTWRCQIGFRVSFRVATSNCHFSVSSWRICLKLDLWALQHVF